jgi:hypothetical protein
MRNVGSLTIGWIDSSIRDSVAAGLPSQFQFVLLTSIDSTANLAGSEIGKRIEAIDPACFCLGAGIVLRGESLGRIAKALDLFQGFDELWCFDNAPEIPKPDDLCIVAPLNLETGRVPACLTSWMAETNCRLALGGGIGLNFATPQPEIAYQLDGLIE